MKKSKSLFLILGALIMIAAAPSASGQTKKTEADTVVYIAPRQVITANRYEKQILETHLPVHVIDTRDIWTRNAATTGEMLAEKPGVSLVETGPWSQKAVIRGLAGSQVLSLVDGLRLDVLRGYGDHAPLVDPDMLDRIEIIRGPASVLYGSDAMGGVVNYMTKKPRFTRSGYHVDGSFGMNFGSVNNLSAQSLSLTAASPRVSLLLGGNYRKADNTDTPAGILANTGFRGYSLNSKLGFDAGGGHTFLVSGQLQRFSDVGIPVNPFAVTAGFKEYNRDTGSLVWEYTNPENILAHVKTAIYLQAGKRNFDALMQGIPKGPLFVTQQLNAVRKVQTRGGHVQARFLFSSSHFLIAGVDGYITEDNAERTADVQLSRADGTIAADPPADLTPPNPAADRKGIGFFFEDEYTPFTDITFLAGFRYDRNFSFASGTPGTLTEYDRRESNHDWSGNFGILYRLSRTLRATANVGRAFSAPTIMQRYFQGTAQVGFLRGNPELASETSLNMDISLKWQAENSSGEISVFRNSISDFIVMTPFSAAADSFMYTNIGRARLYGGEMQTSIQLNRYFSTHMRASYVHGRDMREDVPLPKIPPFSSTLGLRYENSRRDCWAEINVKLVSSQSRTAPNEADTDGYQLLDLHAGMNLTKVWRFGFPVYLTLDVKNLGNVTYNNHLSSVTWWPAPGRNISLGLKGLF